MVGLIVDHLKALKIPLFIIVTACVLTFWVDQISELFYLLVLKETSLQQRVAAVSASLLLGIAVWHTSRTVYRFDIPAIPSLSNPRAEKLREWLPRVLGALIPLLMCIGCLTAIGSPKISHASDARSYVVPIALAIESVALIVMMFWRRKIMGRFVTGFAVRPSGDPRVQRWSQLGKRVRFVYMLLFVGNLLTLIAVAYSPGTIATLGPLTVVLIAATFFTATGTYVTILAARWQFPLLSALFIWAVLLQWAGLNDNHRVRLYPFMNSKDTPDQGRVDETTPLGKPFTDYAAEWRKDIGADDPILLVSAEGGGIRAAAWTARVLLELERKSNGEFSKHMLAGSGVSGGSLGLALFSALIKAREDGVITDLDDAANQFLREDYLGPAIETMFFTDLLQRFWPRPQFVDRGQRLEYGWERAWTRACRGHMKVQTADPKVEVPSCSIFSRPWKELWADHQRVPVLFLNSTVVRSGQRFVQHPFQSVQGGACNESDYSDNVFAGAIGSPCALPASVPLSAVVHNSARFTYISPAGTLILRDKDPGQAVRRSGTHQLQLVDGGYFENSGTATLIEVAQALAAGDPRCTTQLGLAAPGCPIRFVHISNDPAVEAMLPGDGCTATAADEQFGEVLAPLIALLNTRGARGLLARTVLRKETEQRADAANKDQSYENSRLFHFRLCEGRHPLPLGWTLSQASLDEMNSQLRSTSARNVSQVDELSRQLKK